MKRKDIKVVVNILIELLEQSSFEQVWIENYRKDMINYLNQKHKLNQLFPYEFSKDILKVLKVIDEKEENLKRVMSIKCFGDSKYFENKIQHFIIRIVKKYLLDNEQEEYTDDEILLKVGISRYPEVLEFCGNLECVIKSEKIEYKKQTLGSYINSYNVKDMQSIKLINAEKIIFIENKANYIDYILNKQKDNEFVIYHGGMYSPIKGEFFKKIYENSKNSLFYHWSDIDIGGFNIFIRLRSLIPELKPYLMDIQAFYSKKQLWRQMSKEYSRVLEKMRNSQEYEIFYEIMDEMLKNNSKLEQEAFI